MRVLLCLFTFVMAGEHSFAQGHGIKSTSSVRYSEYEQKNSATYHNHGGLLHKSRTLRSPNIHIGKLVNGYSMF